jgi:chromosome segregation ATPase
MSRKRKSRDDISASSSDSSDQSDDEHVDPLTETGQITSVYVENFMCHKKFSVTFGHHLNYITGANGSGKSAIVSAIQLCLGGSSKLTGRGSSLASFIREGSKDESAKLRVTLYNEGPDAYDPHIYGNRIIVERVINPNGTSTIKLCDHRGNVGLSFCFSYIFY